MIYPLCTFTGRHQGWRRRDVHRADPVEPSLPGDPFGHAGHLPLGHSRQRPPRGRRVRIPPDDPPRPQRHPEPLATATNREARKLQLTLSPHDAELTSFISV